MPQNIQVLDVTIANPGFMSVVVMYRSPRSTHSEDLDLLHILSAFAEIVGELPKPRDCYAPVISWTYEKDMLEY